MPKFILLRDKEDCSKERVSYTEIYSRDIKLCIEKYCTLSTESAIRDQIILLTKTKE